MVSALWKACSQGDLDAVNAALAVENVDIEIKDHTGSTPLIEAVKNGNAEIVKVLLDKGANPTNASSQGTPDTYTTDENILAMLSLARTNHSQGSDLPQENGYAANDANSYTPPVNYPYYPSINGAPAPDMYYPPPPPPMHMENNGARHSNLPPPEVASAIPCRYFPACRYGSACLFQHPTGPYFQGPLPPPAPYPTSYEQIPPQPYAPAYYPVSPPSFPPPINGQAPVPPQQGPPMPMHGPPSEMISPSPPQGHFSPNGAPAMGYGPISPIVYSHPGQAPLPMTIPPLPPLHQTPAPAPQSPPAAFNPSSLPAAQSGFAVQQNHAAPYPPVNGNAAGAYAEVTHTVKSPQLSPLPDVVAPRQEAAAVRRGSARRGSFARKQAPPCIFFPLGRCKNGDECRFPHVMPQEGAPAHTPFNQSSRGGGPRPRGHMNGNGFAAIDEKMANLSLQQNGHSGHSGPGSRGRGGKPSVNSQASKRGAPVKQRVPNADEFPVLGGTTTPPTRVGVNGGVPNGNGPTAAQVLQAPRPVRANSSQTITPRGASPERAKEPKPEANGNGTAEPHASLPVSFASIATAGADVAVAA